MLKAFRRNMNAPMLVALVALVLSMGGAAYAAQHYLITSTKQIKPSVLKQLKGQAGPAGPAGAAGALGQTGPVGANGKDGANGTNGASVTSAEVPKTSATCNHQGGSEFTAAGGKTLACNGTTGFTKTLPAGQTETGDWGLIQTAAAAYSHFGVAVSFNIPLETAPTAHFIRPDGKEPFVNKTTKKEEERAQPACEGSAQAPTAAPGTLCVYDKSEENILTSGNTPVVEWVLPSVCSLSSATEFEGCTGSKNEADKYGFGIHVASHEEGPLDAQGTWAVTAEE
jgi:hypothetical protein